jgi:very-short-patch-repair endonuclease
MLDTTEPFRRSRALKAGITPKQLRGPRFRKLFGCVYIDAGVDPDPLHRVKAALLIHKQGAFASHASAGRVYDVPLPPGLAEEHVSVFAAEDRRRRDGICNHVVPESTPTTTHRGVRVSTPAHAFVELAEQLTLVDLVVVGDHLVRRNGITPKQLVAYCSEHGSLAARRAAAYVRRDVDSPMETRLRMLLVLAGLPEPVVNYKVYWENGKVRYRFDLSYPEFRIVVEYDGRQHRADLEQWDHDIERSEWFDDDGWRHVPVFSWGIYKRPDRTLERVRKALGSRGCTELPNTFADDWRPHFPVRP